METIKHMRNNPFGIPYEACSKLNHRIEKIREFASPNKLNEYPSSS